MTDLTGQVVGRYRVIERLGEGGMATVYKAFDTRLECDVALKMIRRTAFGQEVLERILARFQREARVLARLNHPNIVSVIDYGEMDGSPYLVMRYMPGGTLRSQMGRAYAPGDAAAILLPIARALDYAHQQQVLHRDVKPANILLTETGEPVLSDFGIARLLEAEKGATLTGTGVGIGTPEYMAPEQGLGQPVDARADVYALGVVLYELVTGRKPFEGETPMAVMLKQVSEPLPPPRRYVQGLPDRVEKVLYRALAKKPSDRYASMADFAAALQQIAAAQAARRPEKTGQPARIAWPGRGSRAEKTPAQPPAQAARIEKTPSQPGRASRQAGAPAAELPAADLPAIETVDRILTALSGPSAQGAAQAQPRKARRWPLWVGLVLLAAAAAGMLFLPGLLKQRSANATPPAQLAGIATAAATATRESTPSLPTATRTPTISPTASPSPRPSVTPTRVPGTPISAENAARLTLLHRKSSENYVGDAAFVAGTNELIVLYDRPEFLNADTLERSNRTIASRWNSCLAIAPDGKTIAIGGPENTVEIIDLASGIQEILGQHEDGVVFVAFSPEGSTVASTSWDKTVRLWDASRRTQLANIPLRSDFSPALSFSPKGDLLAVAAGDVFQLINPSTGEIVRSIWDPVNGILTLTFSPDGALLAVSGRESISIWRTGTWELARTLGSDKAEVSAVAFAPDGTLLAGGLSDGTVRVWELTYYRQVGKVAVSSGQSTFRWVGFNASGDRLAAATRNQLVLIGTE